jgi:adenylate kinase family enzyme
MKRIIVIGCPGSGKSTLSRRLRDITGLPLFYLDMIFHKSDRTTVSREAFDEKLSGILALDKWIIDGNYSRTMEMRIKRADTVIFLDYPQEICLSGYYSRRGKAREDMPWLEEKDDGEFIDYIKGFRENRRPEIIELMGKYTDKNINIFTSREESENFLTQLNGKE